MTPDGIEKLVGYQQSFFARDWRLNYRDADPAQVMSDYLDAFETLEDDAVLRGYLRNVKNWDRMPSIAQIMTVATGIAHRMVDGVTHDGYRCTVCDLPWNAGRGYGRDDRRICGQIRCPNCNAILERPADGYVKADDIPF